MRHIKAHSGSDWMNSMAHLHVGPPSAGRPPAEGRVARAISEENCYVGLGRAESRSLRNSAKPSCTDCTGIFYVFVHHMFTSFVCLRFVTCLRLRFTNIFIFLG